MSEQWIWRSAIFAAALVGVIAGVVGSAVGGLALNGYNNQIQPLQLYVSGVLPTTPFPIYLNSAGGPMSMTMPADLSPYIGTIYRVWSKTAQPHTIVITAGMGATWDGSATVATFGGAIGDGIVFEVISSNRVAVISVNNVVFS